MVWLKLQLVLNLKRGPPPSDVLVQNEVPPYENSGVGPNRDLNEQKVNAIEGSSSMICGGGVDSVNEAYQQPPNQAGASQDNLGVICNGLEGLRERLERTLSDPEFDTTTSSVIAEIIGLISQVECGLSVGVEWGSELDPELEESLIGLLNDTVSTSFQLDENVRGLLGASVEDVGGRGTLKTMWLKLKEMQRVLKF